MRMGREMSTSKDLAELGVNPATRAAIEDMAKTFKELTKDLSGDARGVLAGVVVGSVLTLGATLGAFVVSKKLWSEGDDESGR
jgi:hypothetical protein